MNATRRALVATTLWALGLSLALSVLGSWWIWQHAWQVELRRPGLLLLLPATLLLYLVVRLVYAPVRGAPGESAARLFVSQGALLSALPRTLAVRMVQFPAALRIVALALVALAVARPQRVDQPDSIELSGIDIVLALDLSGSMRAADLQPTRLEAAKATVDQFIQRRRSDRIGVVAFGREAYTVVPPTLDYTALRRMVGALDLNVIDGSATAIGDGLGTALNRLRRSDARSKVVVLLTDGANNAGHVDPREAAQLAAALHVKVYTILMGTSDEAPIQSGLDLGGRPVFTMARFPVDPRLLEEIASATGGQFFRAVDRSQLEQSFHTILDHLERSKLADAGVRYGELYPHLSIAALALLALEALLAATRLRRFP